MERQKLIQEIVAKEWAFFQKVQNEGGRADCQDNPWTFRVMRESQFKAWTEEALQSYRGDLEKAEAEGRNLLTEKYAYMMRYTAPEDFARMAHLLPEITEAKLALAEEAAKIHIRWHLAYEDLYPGLSDRGRPVYSSEDTPYSVSFETYLKGELLTYSEDTLRIYLDDIRKKERDGENLILEIMRYTVEAYGYQSLEEAEKSSGH